MRCFAKVIDLRLFGSCKSPRLLCTLFSIMHTDPKTSKDPQYFVRKNIQVESDRYQLGVHSISRVGFVGLSRSLDLTLSDVKRIVFLGKDVSDGNKMLLSQAVDIFHKCIKHIVDSITGSDFIHGQTMGDSNFTRVHCGTSKVVTAGMFHVFGEDVAELPLVAISETNQGKVLIELKGSVKFSSTVLRGFFVIRRLRRWWFQLLRMLNPCGFRNLVLIK
ncbi:hypothetical protein Lser_V15G03705 [Lactuca serriola]